MRSSKQTAREFAAAELVSVHNDAWNGAAGGSIDHGGRCPRPARRRSLNRMPANGTERALGEAMTCGSGVTIAFIHGFRGVCELSAAGLQILREKIYTLPGQRTIPRASPGPGMLVCPTQRVYRTCFFEAQLRFRFTVPAPFYPGHRSHRTEQSSSVRSRSPGQVRELSHACS